MVPKQSAPAATMIIASHTYPGNRGAHCATLTAGAIEVKLANLVEDELTTGFKCFLQMPFFNV